ncbi:S8 family peptidase (plasmid) [Bacillus subtilis]|nr:S8 family peptidase [Bacillus subtilis]WOF33000.1 S8 family peptidase [Bacillus subtilis]
MRRLLQNRGLTMNIEMQENLIDIKNSEIDIQIIDSLDNELDIDWGLKTINAPRIWNKTKGEGVKILLIDTGIDTDHPDLKDSFKAGYNFFERSYNVEDEQGHGSHVAGILIGKHTGVAPEAELHVVKVLNNDGRGTMASVMDGITYAINYNFDIICMSLGVPSELPVVFQERIAEAYNKGIVMVCATGNSGANDSLFPARMDEVIAVGGLDRELKVSKFTNGGYDVLAPSVEILSTYKDNNYARMSGTSMASPLVAGGIALLISYYRKQGKELKPIEIMNMIKELKGSAFDLTKLMD